MIKRDVTFINFENVEETRTLWFHVDKTRLQNFVEEVVSRLEELVNFLKDRDPEAALDMKDVGRIQELVEYFVGLSYGIRDDDEFMQELPDGRKAIDKLRNQAVYGELIFQLMRQPGSLFKFIMDVIPSDLLNESLAQMKQEQPEMAKTIETFRETGVVEVPEEPTSVAVEGLQDESVESLKERLRVAEEMQKNLG